MKNSTYKSYPKGTLILVRDLRPKVHKKLKPLYYKAPQKIITEYRCTVYAMDFLGKVRKHSKNNIKIASNRSNFLFSSLPDDIKIVLGDEFNPFRAGVGPMGPTLFQRPRAQQAVE
jgi:hypothetical protein